MGEILNSPEIPPKLCKLGITDRKVDGVTLFNAPNLEIPGIRSLYVNRSVPFADGVTNLLKVFKNLEYLELEGQSGVSGLWDELSYVIVYSLIWS